MLRLECGFFLAALAAFAPAAPGAALAPDHPVVPGFERFHAGAKADARGGRLLLAELGCVRCHDPGSVKLLGKQGPNLDGVATRVRVGYLKKLLADPQAAKPGTTMPHLLTADPDKAAKVEALVQFLASTGTLLRQRPTLKSIAAGRDLYHKVGCVACHGTRTGNGDADKTLPGSVPLGDLKAKYGLGGLAAFLADPLHARPSGRMPRLLNAQEAKDVANYLLQGGKYDLAAGKGATKYAYYEGEWGKLPDFAKLKPVAGGVTGGFDLGVAWRGHSYGLKFDAVFQVKRPAVYTFTLASDDGSRLLLDGKTVVDNDGLHPTVSRQGRLRLSKGFHKVTVLFFQAGGGADLEVHVEAPGFGRHNLGDLVAVSEAAFAKKPAPKKGDEDAIEIRPALVEKGKALLASLGCASCHSLQAGGKPIASALKSPPLVKLNSNGGCLSEKPAQGVPWYSLSADQRKALAAGIREKAIPTPAAAVAQTLAAFNCYACHARDKVGGPEEELNKFFLTTQPEMGDEGRVPPPLDGVGAKLRADYLRQLLDRGGHDRPYMHTRMPGFGAANVGHLVEAFAALDKLPAVPKVAFTESLPRVKAAGRQLVGALQFACIKCHTFAGHKAEGVQGIDMTALPKRLRREWFHAYVNDPQKVRPGTRMPSGFFEGKSILPEVLDGKAVTQIEAMWLYLQDGGGASLPLGLQKHFIPLVPTTGAIIYRNFIAGLSPRGIAVGYPEKLHLAFDANEMRLALLWQGAFIDAARHWTDRGAGFEPPLGDNVLRLPGGVPFAVLAKPDAPWPTGTAKERGYRFRGYRLTPDDRPTFLYSLKEIKISDFPNPTSAKEPTLKRTITAAAPKGVENLYFRAAVGDKVEPLAGGWYRVDGAWKIKLSKGAVVRKSAGKTELLVPIPFKEYKAVLRLEYAW
jgi:cytochrome c553